MSDVENSNPNEAAGVTQDENHVIAERREKLKAIREKGVAFPNDFKPEHAAQSLHDSYDASEGEALDAQQIQVSIAGRMMLKRVMGKASFATVQDKSGRIQVFVTRETLGEEV